MNPEYKSPAWLKQRLENAINTFNTSDDLFLLKDELTDEGNSDGAVGERAIAHRLAVHLENEIENEFKKHGYPDDKEKIVVDCEYNRHRGAIKDMLVKDKLRKRVEAAKGRLLKEHPKKKGWYVFSVYPDIIAHHRGDDFQNLIAIELKCASNTIDDPLDNVKLEIFTTQDYEHGYRYIFGASVIAFDADKFGERRLELGKTFVDPKLTA